jgi:hypothetical protein
MGTSNEFARLDDGDGDSMEDDDGKPGKGFSSIAEMLRAKHGMVHPTQNDEERRNASC